MKSFISEFKEFALRGNVMDMAIGIIIGAAFTAIVTALVDNIISPIIGMFVKVDFNHLVATVNGVELQYGAFIMAIVTVLLVVMVAQAARGNQVLTVVLAGVMVSSLLSAGVSFTKLIADPTDQLPAITYWLMGSLTGAKLTDITLAAPPMIAGLVVLFVLKWRINILTMGDDEASTMGVNTKALRLIIILAATLVTAASVAVTGMIGWVGLVIPHLSRMLIGSDYRKLMPASMLMGASFLLLVDDVSRLATTAEIPIGILTAFIGAPFFLYLITREGRKRK